MKKYLFIILCTFGNIFFADAQTEEYREKNRIAVSGELTSCDTWQIDISYHYMLCSYASVGASIGMWKQYTVDGIPKNQGWRIREDNEKVENFYLRPSICLFSPAIIRFSDGELKVFVEPGMMMNIPYCKVCISLKDSHGMENGYEYVSSNSGRWHAFDCKMGLFLNLGTIGFSAGYVYSDLDIFAMRRNMVFRGQHFSKFYPGRKYLHGGFISMFYNL